MIKLNKSPFYNYHNNSWFGQETMDDKTTGEKIIGNIQSFHIYLLITKGRRYLYNAKYGGHYLNQVTELNLTK